MGAEEPAETVTPRTVEDMFWTDTDTPSRPTAAASCAVSVVFEIVRRRIARELAIE